MLATLAELLATLVEVAPETNGEAEAEPTLEGEVSLWLLESLEASLWLLESLEVSLWLPESLEVSKLSGCCAGAVLEDWLSLVAATLDSACALLSKKINFRVQ